MKYSKQRELIYEAVMKNQVHPTADTVYSIIREENPNISLGTVYRNLNFLADNGLLLKIAMPDAPDRFDGRIDEHYHMSCIYCKTIFDIEPEAVSDFLNKISDSSGFLIEKAHLVVEGICLNCKDKCN